ncbi:MAG: Flagellar motor switch protein FliG [Candidatus Carbobacillus altaicus]|uniref:Flagellar motor switch protein FliG n=1 Tax=Candidatus Carbonibacillus altaicus TaxID=2163959 RepID=A0A2R6Y4V8_9BACL|nr:MAG: Flagellar motor switch protein FliG [Candidatus Carbobacillus altaicus]
MARATKELNGRQKAAILLIALGPETSAQIFKHLREDEIERLTFEIASVTNVDPEEKTNILKEFQQLVLAQQYLAQGGIQYAREILEKALGTHKAHEVLGRLTATLQVRPFDFMKKADALQILNFLQNEHPQTIALVLSYLDPKQSSQILSALSPEMQAEVAMRIATMSGAAPEVIDEIERILEQKLATSAYSDLRQAGGVEAVVDILNGVDRSTERTILEALEEREPELAEEIKKRMFVFEDIVLLDDRSVQRVIREVANEDLLLALKAASEDVKALIFKNMSTRMAETFREEMEYMGPVRLRDVEEAQTRIVATIRRLEEAGEIVISRGGGDEFIV